MIELIPNVIWFNLVVRESQPIGYHSIHYAIHVVDSEKHIHLKLLYYIARTYHSQATSLEMCMKWTFCNFMYSFPTKSLINGKMSFENIHIHILYAVWTWTVSHNNDLAN